MFFLLSSGFEPSPQSEFVCHSRSDGLGWRTTRSSVQPVISSSMTFPAKLSSILSDDVKYCCVTRTPNRCPCHVAAVVVQVSFHHSLHRQVGPPHPRYKLGFKRRNLFDENYRGQLGGYGVAWGVSMLSSRRNRFRFVDPIIQKTRRKDF